MNLPKPDSKAYSAAKPFPHLVIDNVFHKFTLRSLLESWPEVHEGSLSDKDQKSKHFTNSEKHMGHTIADFIKVNFQSQEFILFLEELTGIKGLVMDIRGGYGLHETYPGGKLMPHLDYLIHDVTGLQHRVNAILYLNEVESGGELELYERAVAYGGILTSKVSIKPMFNRIAIFNINDMSWNGHSEPVTGIYSRKSIALNYFSVPEAKAKKQGTIFAGTSRSLWKECIPPILYRLLK